MRLLVPTLVLGVALASAGCGSRTTDDRAVPVAFVDDAPISAEWFETAYVEHLIATGANDTPTRRYAFLDNLVDGYLLADEAVRRGLDREAAFQRFADRERQKALGGAFFREAFLETLPPPTEDELRRAFARSKQQVVVRHLFYRDEAEAWAAHARLEAGRSFLEEAQQCYNLAAFDSSAGYLGPIRYFQVDDAFAEAAFALEAGAYSEPVRSRWGLHIIRVEDRFTNPLLTEDEFQERRGRISSQVRLRRRRVEGDRFVRDFMRDLDVRVEAEAVRALTATIEELEHTARPEPGPLLDESAPIDRDALLEALRPETVLATYAWDGERKAFTAAEYHFWLPELPFREARQRTAASVGRALRNHVFAQAGAERGVDEDEVAEEVERRTRAYLAVQLRRQLRAAPPAGDPDPALVQAAYDRYGGDDETVTASFWVIPAASLDEAETIKEHVAGDLSAAPDRAGFVQHEAVDVGTVAMWGYYAGRAPVGQPVVVGTEDGWGVLYVAKREKARVPAAERRAEVMANLAPLMGEVRLLRELRAAATVRIDSTRFERLMELDASD